jgi:hypothetical protein
VNHSAILWLYSPLKFSNFFWVKINYFKNLLHEKAPFFFNDFGMSLFCIEFTKNFNKDYKYTVGDSWKMETIEILTMIYRANSRKDKGDVLQEAREWKRLFDCLSV